MLALLSLSFIQAHETWNPNRFFCFPFRSHARSNRDDKTNSHYFNVFAGWQGNCITFSLIANYLFDENVLACFVLRYESFIIRLFISTKKIAPSISIFISADHNPQRIIILSLIFVMIVIANDSPVGNHIFGFVSSSK